VQIIEATEAGVRSVKLRLQRPGSSLQFLLYPMVHVGRPEFYQEVTRRLGLVDLIVVEGVVSEQVHRQAEDRAASNPPAESENRSAEPVEVGVVVSDREQEFAERAAAMVNRVARFRSPLYWLTATYRAMPDDERLGLVEQNIDYDAIGVPVICPDVTVEQFEEQWRTIAPWKHGAIIAATVPFVAAQRVFGSDWLQDRLQNYSIDDRPTAAEEWGSDAQRELNRVVLDERDLPLLKALTTVHEERGHEPITVAVVYGAGHIRAVLKGLRPLGYRVVSGDWLTVMTF
jgi:hypothetical protein